MTQSPTPSHPGRRPADEDSLVGTDIVGRYRLIESIGQGGAGLVYRATQLELDREVAIKLVRTDLPPRARKELERRFRREAALAGKLSHPNVVTVHDFGTTEDGTQFVAMELLTGRSLKRAAKAGPMEPHAACKLAEGVALGLQHAHDAGLVHRDVKTSNVFLVPDGKGGERPMLLDFGLVKDRSDQEHTRSGTYMGTPLYTAPEQATGRREIDGRADLYSLGCVLYELLAGVVPYRGDSAIATTMMHVTDPYPPIAKRAPGVRIDPQLESIVRRCLEKEPEDRWPSAGDLAVALEGWRTGVQTATAVGAQQRWVAPIVGGAGLVGLAGLALGGLGIVAVVVAGVVLSTRSATTTPAAPAVTATVPTTEPVEVPEPIATTVPVEVSEAPTPPVTEVVAPTVTPAPPQPRPPATVVTRPTPRPVAKPAAPTPRPTPTPPPSTPRPRPSSSVPDVEPGMFLVDNVAFTEAEAAAALSWLNRAERRQLEDAGVWDKGADAILASRPYTTLQQVGDTRMIGEKTMLAIKAAANR